MENTQNRTSSKAAPEHEEQEQIESETPKVRRSTRERRPPAWHSEYVTESNIAYCLLTEDGEPSSFHEAIKSTYGNKCFVHSLHPAHRLVDFVARKDIVTVMTEVVSNISPPPGSVATVSDAPPIHYMVKIELFSSLGKNAVETYESGVFEAGGYRWKLVLYPNGNKSNNVKDYISLYLAMVDAGSLPRGWEVNVIFRLFLLDQSKDSYLVIQGMFSKSLLCNRSSSYYAAGKERRFHGLNLQSGFDQFIKLSTFNDARYGFLLDDNCVLGAEVFVCGERSRGKGEVLSMKKDPTASKYTWKIVNFFKLDEKRQESQIFSTGDHQWKMVLYPKGKGLGTGTHLSLYLALDLATLPAGCRVYADYALRIVDQVYDRKYDWYGKAKSWFGASSSENGWSTYGSLINIYKSQDYLVAKDICIIEAEVMLLGIGSPF
ncbi:hypothetical protein POTOM_030717 [Populus tomentosa]|uniref:MATH domain-containing protein n=1 Tax=Populus tomentosa TaxID=118781 RepID=A0A8X7Z2T4_POPTO|nr:hypothetical protein POTOM_030717 [Populus tomentosa]